MARIGIILFTAFFCVLIVTGQTRIPYIHSTRSKHGKKQLYKKNKQIRFNLYNKIIGIDIEGDPAAASIIFVSPHDNETTAQSVIVSYLKTHNQAYVRIENDRRRLISVMHGKRRYTFDPNRIFTPKGIQRTLHLYGLYSGAVAIKIRRLANLVLSQFSFAKTVVALHNNTNGKYCLLSYLPHGRLAKNAIRVYRVPRSDPDDFFLTTSLLLFRKLKAKKFNVVLQDNKNVTDDGSLSVYFSKIKKRYINIEAQQGHFAKQTRMLHALMAVLR